MKCDFCSTPDPIWQYPSQNFIAVSGGYSTGEWIACENCHKYIEGKEWELLAARSARLHPFVISGLIPMPQAHHEMLKIYLKLQQSRRGDPVRIT